MARSPQSRRSSRLITGPGKLVEHLRLQECPTATQVQCPRCSGTGNCLNIWESKKHPGTTWFSCNGCGGLFGKYAPLFPGATHSYFQSFYPSSASQKSHMGDGPDAALIEHGPGGSGQSGSALTMSSDPFVSPSPASTLRHGKPAARPVRTRHGIAVPHSSPQKKKLLGVIQRRREIAESTLSKLSSSSSPEDLTSPSSGASSATKSAHSSTSAVSRTSTLVGSARSILGKKKLYEPAVQSEAAKQWDALFEDEDDVAPPVEATIIVPETPPMTPVNAPRGSPPSPSTDHFAVPETPPRKHVSLPTPRRSSQQAARPTIPDSDEDMRDHATQGSSKPGGGSDKENQPIPTPVNEDEASSEESDGWAEPFMGASEPDNQVEATDTEAGSDEEMDIDSSQLVVHGAENDLMDVEDSSPSRAVNLETTFANFGIDASHVSAELSNAVEDGYPIRLLSDFGRNYLSSGSAVLSTSKPLLFGRSLMDRDRLLRMSIPSLFFAAATTSPRETARTIGRVMTPVLTKADKANKNGALGNPQELLILWTNLADESHEAWVQLKTPTINYTRLPAELKQQLGAVAGRAVLEIRLDWAEDICWVPFEEMDLPDEQPVVAFRFVHRRPKKLSVKATVKNGIGSTSRPASRVASVVERLGTPPTGLRPALFPLAKSVKGRQGDVSSLAPSALEEDDSPVASSSKLTSGRKRQRERDDEPELEPDAKRKKKGSPPPPYSLVTDEKAKTPVSPPENSSAKGKGKARQ